jgi:hypothetical protein
MENKQTAVEWLVKHLSERGYIQAPSFGHSIIDKAIEQAKEMEKQQIIKAYETAMETDIYNEPLKIGKYYYNETFNQQEQ